MRRLDRLLALIVGLSLAAVAVVAGIEIMALLLGDAPVVIPRHSWNAELRAERWNSFGIQLSSAVLAGAGAVVTILQLIRRQPVRLALRSRPGQRVWVSRQGLARRLAYDVAKLDGVKSSKFKVSRRRVRARVVLTVGTDRAAGAEEVRKTSTATLVKLGPVRDLAVRVSASVARPPAISSPS